MQMRYVGKEELDIDNLVRKVVDIDDLVTFEESREKQIWIDTMRVEYDASIKNEIWEFIELWYDKNPIGDH